MSDEVKRIPRRERAARTRRQIVDAVTIEFCAEGYHGATMASIARQAGVAVQTVYFVFNTKSALLTATIDHAVMGADDLPPQEMPWWQEGTTTADGRRAIELFVASTARIETRAAALNRVSRTAAATDPELGKLLVHHQTLRSAGFARYVELLDRRGLLSSGSDLGEVTDVFLTMLGSEVFLDFTQARGWGIERYTSWTTDALCTLYLKDPGTAQPTGGR